MNILKTVATVVLATSAFAACASDVVVIVNKANDNTVDRALVAKIYLGESKQWSGGGAIVAYDVPEDNPAKASFDADVVGKSPAALKSLWAQNVFTGKSVPPKLLSSDDEVKKAVGSNKNAIGYIKAGSLDDSVKQVAK